MGSLNAKGVLFNLLLFNGNIIYLFKMKNIFFSLLFICVICISSSNSTPARNVPIPSYPQAAAPPHYNQGLQYGDLGCCRSSFPDEYGSCRKRSDCPLRTQPYCSGYGFCTQSQDYGTDGCQDNCPKPSYAKY